jgi:hypothetical protein
MTLPEFDSMKMGALLLGAETVCVGFVAAVFGWASGEAWVWAFAGLCGVGLVYSVWLYRQPEGGRDDQTRS